ncbi:MAG: HSP90 family molecular chaperone, partial [Myxococcota bacterium]
MATTSNLAQQALNNLVNQFARPMDFLRELVQNSIDAGTPRVEVWLKHNAPADGERDGVLEIHIDDFGEGMDEGIIDEQLTRMFSSTKEDDLTKIGKFGIGFTSIFAIHPEAVLLHTGRHGDFWELLFHPDRSFDKVRVDRPVQGTRITLLKRMAEQEVEKFIREARWILRYWCEHSDTPVTFWDRTDEQEIEAVDSADPFAAFSAPVEAPTEPLMPAAPTGPDRVTRPLDLEADLTVELHE